MYVCRFRDLYVKFNFNKIMYQLSTTDIGKCFQSAFFFPYKEPVYQHISRCFVISLQIRAVLISNVIMWLSDCLFKNIFMILLWMQGSYLVSVIFIDKIKIL